MQNRLYFPRTTDPNRKPRERHTERTKHAGGPAPKIYPRHTRVAPKTHTPFMQDFQFLLLLQHTPRRLALADRMLATSIACIAAYAPASYATVQTGLMGRTNVHLCVGPTPDELWEEELEQQEHIANMASIADEIAAIKSLASATPSDAISAAKNTATEAIENPEAVGGAEQWDEDRESQAFLQEFAALEKQVIALQQVANSDPEFGTPDRVSALPNDTPGFDSNGNAAIQITSAMRDDVANEDSGAADPTATDLSGAQELDVEALKLSLAQVKVDEEQRWKDAFGAEAAVTYLRKESGGQRNSGDEDADDSGGFEVVGTF